METFLHSGIYEALPEINVIFHTHASDVLKVAEKIGIPSTAVEQPAGSQTLTQEALDFVNQNKSIKYFVLKNHGVIALGATMSEAGKLMEDMHNKAKNTKASKKRLS